MTLVHTDPSDPECKEPRTHVLIAGVSHYTTFKDGGGEVGEVSLASLTAPVRSAKALADWYIDHYNYPPAPLGSVDLLLSDRSASRYRGQIVDAASYAEFAPAAQAWRRRGSHPDSRLIFVFSGHGFGKEGAASLLFSDFDGRRDDCWNSALELNAFIAGLAETAASEQLFFVDACRKPHPAHIGPGAVIGTSPVQVRSSTPRADLPRRIAPTFFSTGQDEGAHAPIGGVSVFTTAFLRAMNGMAAGDEEGEWRVDSYGMLSAMDHVSQRLTRASFPAPQQPQGTDAHKFDIHHLIGDPVAPVYIERTDGGAHGDARIHCRRGRKALVHDSRADVPELEVELPYGPYTFQLVDADDLVVSEVEGLSRPIYRRARFQP